MKLSIVIPTYNEERRLPALFASLKRQTFQDFEVIVADAHSKDMSRAIAEANGARVVDGGLPGVGRNRGAAVAKGEILLFLDADMVLTSERFLENTLKEFKERSFAIATCMMDADSRLYRDRFMVGFYNVYALLTTKILPHAPGFCIFVLRSLHEKIKGFDETVVFAEDMDYAQRAVHYGKFGFLKSERIPYCVRRFERDGRFRTAVRFSLAELYILTQGSIKSDIFKYRFGYDGVKEKKKKQKIMQ